MLYSAITYFRAATAALTVDWAGTLLRAEALIAPVLSQLVKGRIAPKRMAPTAKPMGD